MIFVFSRASTFLQNTEKKFSLTCEQVSEIRKTEEDELLRV
jgi:hypothetical protein